MGARRGGSRQPTPHTDTPAPAQEPEEQIKEDDLGVTKGQICILQEYILLSSAPAFFLGSPAPPTQPLHPDSPFLLLPPPSPVGLYCPYLRPTEVNEVQ